MNINSMLKQFADLLYSDGEPCDFGCAESEQEFMLTRAQQKYPSKGICVVRDWIWWDYDIDEKGKLLFAQHGLKPSIIYARYLLWDQRDRWPVGSFVRTTPLVSFEENCLFVTRNTAYILVGKGSRKTVDPTMANCLQ